jgi:predicted phage terminase large subunit-like protein
MQWRQAARTNLFFLMHRVLNYPLPSEEVHGDIVRRLQQFQGGVDYCHPETGKLLRYEPAVDMWDLEGARVGLFLDPRGTFKTTVITMSHSIQWTINYYDIRVLLSMATEKQTRAVLKEIKAHYQFNPIFRWLFPEVCPPAKRVADWGSQEGFVIPARRRKAMKEPTIHTCSIGAVIAGFHYEVIKCSDLVDKENVKTPDSILRTIEHYGYMNPMLEPAPDGKGRGWITVEGTRYDFSDLYGTIQDGELERPVEKRRYSILVRSARSSEPVLESLPNGEIVQRPENGKPLYPQRWPLEELDRLEADPTVGPWITSCFPAETPILMADWQEKSISHIRPGDEVVGYEVKRGSKGKSRARLVPAKVLHVHPPREGIVARITLESGREIFCTPDHKWWSGRTDSQRNQYLPARRGRKLYPVYRRRIERPFAKRMLDWLGGMMDGEGTISGKNNPVISQSRKKNPEVCEQIEIALSYLQIPYKYHNSSASYQLHGGRSLSIRLLQKATMAKKQRFIDNLWSKAGGVTERNAGLDRVIAVNFDSRATVYNFETTTGNYVAWGYAAKNCQWYNNPLPPKGGLATKEEIKWIPWEVVKQLNLREHVTVDLAGMEQTRTNTDFTSITHGGFDRDGRLYIKEIYYGRFTPFQVINILFQLYENNRRIEKVKVEKDNHARVLLPFLHREEEKRGIFLPIIAVPIDTTRTKKEKLRALQPWFELGHIRFADTIGPKVQLIAEITRFPKYQHDHILDNIREFMEEERGEVDTDVLPAPVHPMARPNKFEGYDPTTHEPMWTTDLYGTDQDGFC